jgi:hypothetical protein
LAVVERHDGLTNSISGIIIAIKWNSNCRRDGRRGPATIFSYFVVD